MRSVLGHGDAALRVPYWALPARDILSVFAGSASPTTRSRFDELVTDERRAFVTAAPWLKLATAAVTPDTPVPFDLRKVWYQLDFENNETRTIKSDPNSVCTEDEGDSAALSPAGFTSYSPVNNAPFKGPLHGVHASVPELLRLGLRDQRLRFFASPWASHQVPTHCQRLSRNGWVKRSPSRCSTSVVCRRLPATLRLEWC